MLELLPYYIPTNLPEYTYPVVAAGALFLIYLGFAFQPRTYFFIRHGRTLLNEQHIKQGSEGELSEAGIAQAEALGKSLKRMRIQHIYTSDYERAVQTATIIDGYLHRGVTKTDLLAERRNASEVIGKKTKDEEVEKIVNLTDLRFHEDTYRYSDEENFADLHKRAMKALTYLRGRPYYRMCIVTHHAFLHMLLSTMLLGRKLNAESYIKLAFFNPAENGGITICTYHPWRRFNATGGWEIRAYNEQVISS